MELPVKGALVQWQVHRSMHQILGGARTPQALFRAGLLPAEVAERLASVLI